MSDTHKTISTPNPSERALVVTVDEKIFASNGGVIPDEGTLYSSEDFKTFFGRDYNKEFSNFVYTGQTKEHGLLFARNKTEEQMATPFRTTTWTGNHRWPPILLYVGFEADYVALRSYPASNGTTVGTAFAPNYYDKVVYIPDVSEGTRFVKDEFFAPRPFDIPQMPVPIPTAVQYILPNGSGQSFPECLHPTIVIPDFVTGISQTVGGSSSGLGGSVKGQKFPATNFETWAPYVLSDRDEYQNGGWYRVRIRVYPPAQPEPIVRLSR